MSRIIYSTNNMVNYIKCKELLDLNNVKYVSFVPGFIDSLSRRNSPKGNKLNCIALISGILGFILMGLLQYQHLTDYRMLLSSKTFYAIVPSLPIMFISGILFSSLITFIVFLIVVKNEKMKYKNLDIDSEKYNLVIGTDNEILIKELKEIGEIKIS